jgi:hypothetical protein
MLVALLSLRHGVSSGHGFGEGLQLWPVAENILNKQSQTADKRWSSTFGVRRGDNNS